MTKHHIIISGTGRAGTTFLMQLLTTLGLDTGFEDTTSHVTPINNGGMERDILQPNAPYIVKSPRLCEYLDDVLEDKRIIIDHAIIPVRDLYAAAESRRDVTRRADAAIYPAGWPVPGGVWPTDKPEPQETILADKLYKIIHTIAKRDIPITLLHFPRLVHDPEYLYKKIKFVLNGTSYEKFMKAYAQVVQPEIVHDFSANNHTDAPTSSQAESLSVVKFIEEKKDGSLRDRIRHGVVKAVEGEPLPGAIGLIGRILARSRTLRERAFFNITIDELLPRKTQPRRALDIGYGSGQMLVKLRQIGWEATGVEFYEKAASIAHLNGKTPIVVGDLHKLDLPKGKYDLIYLSRVFEHVENPDATLRRLNDLLTPDGRIVLICQNPYSIGARISTNNWLRFEPPKHSRLLQPKAYGEAATLAGLKIKTIYTQCTPMVGLMCIAKALHKRKGKEINDISTYNFSAQEKLIYFLERMAIRLGFTVGEEVVVTMEKARD